MSSSFRTPGPTTGFQTDGTTRIRPDAGTMVRALSRGRGPDLDGMAAAPLVEATIDDVSWLDTASVAEALWDALTQASATVAERVYDRTGMMMRELLQTLLPTLLMAVGFVAASTALGAAIGGALGLLFGGVGAAPGAVLGGDIGFSVGNTILLWMGLAFLVGEIVSGLPEMGRLAERGARRAAGAVMVPANRRERQIAGAAEDFADAVALMFVLVLQGVVAWLLKRPSIAAARGAAGSMRTAAGAVRSGTAPAAAEAAVAELVAQLRSSQLGSGFANWIEVHWRELIENPKLI